MLLGNSFYFASGEAFRNASFLAIQKNRLLPFSFAEKVQDDGLLIHMPYSSGQIR